METNPEPRGKARGVAAAAVAAGLLLGTVLAGPTLAGGEQAGPARDGGGAIEIRPPAPPDPRLLARMQLWHARYRHAVGPVWEPLGAVLRSLARDRFEGLAPACARLTATLDRLDPADLLPAPDYATSIHLETALVHLGRAARACRADRPVEVAYQLGEMRQALANARLALRRYGLAP
jgi:hypothetical protein